MIRWFFSQLWTRSLSDLFYACLRKLGFSSTFNPVPRWCRVIGGPLSGVELFMAPEAVDFWAAMGKGDHDSFIFDAIGQRLNSLMEKNCWDIGAHVGYHSMTFSRMLGPATKIIAFEPNPDNLRRFENHLQRNHEFQGKITILPFAISDSVGKASFIFSNQLESGMSSGSHLACADTPHSHQDYKMFTECEVVTTTIDTLIETGFENPSLIKVDVEGSEAAVLRGGSRFISKFKPFLLIPP